MYANIGIKYTRPCLANKEKGEIIRKRQFSRNATRIRTRRKQCVIKSPDGLYRTNQLKTNSASKHIVCPTYLYFFYCWVKSSFFQKVDLSLHAVLMSFQLRKESNYRFLCYATLKVNNHPDILFSAQG